MRTLAASLILLALLSPYTPTPARAAGLGYVQGNAVQITSGSTLNVPFTSAVTAGNAIVVYVIWGSITSTASVSDSRGTIYTPATPPTRRASATVSAQVFSGTGVAGGANTVTVTFSAPITNFGIGYVHEYAGIDPVNPFDGAVATTGASASPTSGTLTTTNANDLLFVAVDSDQFATGTPASFTARSHAFGNLTADRIVSSAGSYSATAMHNGTQWIVHLVAFRAAGSTPQPTATPTSTPTQGPTSTATPVPPTPTSTATPGPQTQPWVSASANHRYLIDQSGQPWLMRGDSAQGLFGNLTEADADQYFAARQAQGWNAAWVNLLCASYTGCPSTGNTVDGIAPFTTSGDLSTPNPAYFERADHMLQIAANRGIVLLLDPAETGSWLGTLRGNGLTKAYNYGAFLGQRYRNQPNIIWMSGNDFQSWRTASDDALVQAVARGIRDNAPQLQTIELDYYRSSSTDDAAWSSTIGLDAAYSYYPTFDQVLKSYNRSIAPVFMVEANYEGEQNFTDFGSPLILRRQAYWTLLSGASGQVYGSGTVNHFKSGWQSALNSTGAQQFGIANNLLGARRWYDLIPDQAHTLVTAGNGTYDANTSLGNSDYVTAARTADGLLAMVYMPSRRTIAVDMSQMAGSVTARWFDPSNGTFTPASTPFTPPLTNAAGDSDWLLLLEAAAQPPTATPTATPVPTDTPVPTATPTALPTSTATTTPVPPTNTPIPTATATPIAPCRVLVSINGGPAEYRDQSPVFCGL